MSTVDKVDMQWLNALKAESSKIDVRQKRARRTIAEKKSMLKKTDGRSLRQTGRTKQMNIRVKPSVKDAVHKKANQLGISIPELFEQLLPAIKRLKAKGEK